MANFYRMSTRWWWCDKRRSSRSQRGSCQRQIRWQPYRLGSTTNCNLPTRWCHEVDVVRLACFVGELSLCGGRCTGPRRWRRARWRRWRRFTGRWGRWLLATVGSGSLAIGESPRAESSDSSQRLQTGCVAAQRHASQGVDAPEHRQAWRCETRHGCAWHGNTPRCGTGSGNSALTGTVAELFGLETWRSRRGHETGRRRGRRSHRGGRCRGGRGGGLLTWTSGGNIARRRTACPWCWRRRRGDPTRRGEPTGRERGRRQSP